MKNYRLHFMQPVHMEWRVPKTRWVVLRWPNDSGVPSGIGSRLIPEKNP